MTKARKNEAELLKLASDIKILLYWRLIDILSLAGPPWAERLELMNFIIYELTVRESKAYKGIKSLRIALSHQKENLLAFAQVLDQKKREYCPKVENSSVMGARGLFTNEEAHDH